MRQLVLKESLEVSLEIEDLQPGDSLSFCRPGIQKGIFKKLKKGQYSIGAELDLHGHTRPEAQVALAKFHTVFEGKIISDVYESFMAKVIAQITKGRN